MAKKRKSDSWYPVSTLGLVCTGLYALVPPYIVYAQSTNTFPQSLEIPLVGGMLFILACMLISRHTNQKPFYKKSHR
ncbi:MAG TPA: hypothetical protein VN665_00520 [Candidatus Paceibacterota bacterium]|nr:hypothetical protein [Candidatus Paceibacterota bacterium]